MSSTLDVADQAVAPGEPADAHPEHDLVLVVDYGAQYAQLIARRVREARVYSEIVPHTMPVERMLERSPKAIILSGGPRSVYAPEAPQVDPTLFDTGVAVFGICYGFQAMAGALGGDVRRTGTSEFGRTDVQLSPGSTLLDGPPERTMAAGLRASTSSTGTSQETISE